MIRETPLLFLVAGEASGDQLGAGLMAALLANGPKKIKFAGIGGEKMAVFGLKSFFPMSELSVMGLVEVLPRIPRLLVRIQQTVDLIKRLKPTVIVTIDSPGFTFRLASRLKDDPTPIIHYVAPTVWAWKPHRAEEMASLFDHVMVLLPFEPKYFSKVGLECTFVGHPAALPKSGMESPDFRKKYEFGNEIIIGVFPGSRETEVRRLLPVYGETIRRLKSSYKHLRIIIVTVPNLKGLIETLVLDWETPITLFSGNEDRWSAYRACDVALATSGTITTELAAVGTPMVVGYKMASLTMALAKKLVNTSHITLINLVLGKTVIPEFIQSNCNPKSLSTAISTILENDKIRSSQLKALKLGIELLSGGELSPSDRAAEVVRRKILTEMDEIKFQESAK